MSRRAKVSIGVVTAIIIGGWAALTAARGRNNGVEVRIEEVASRDLVASVTASGKVEPKSKVDVASDVTGRIVRLAVREGDMVTRGQFLLQIDPTQPRAAVERQQAAVAAARADLARARANLTMARANYERMQAVKQATPNLVSSQELENLRTQFEVAEAQYEAGRHQVAQYEAALRDAQSALGKTTIVAPMSGKITRLAVEEGETAIMGTLNKDAATLLTIADMSVLETKVRVDETDVARIGIGDSAVVEIDAFPDTTFVGRVVDISNSSVRDLASGQPAADQAVDYEVKIQLVNPPAETRPDFSTTAKIVTAIRRNALSIPIIALTVREHEQPAASDEQQPALVKKPARQVGKRDVEGVFVVGPDQKVVFRPVRIGIAGEEHFEVVSGLKPGERIVAGSYQAIRELKDGALVRQAETPKNDAKSGGQS